MQTVQPLMPWPTTGVPHFIGQLVRAISRSWRYCWTGATIDVTNDKGRTALHEACDSTSSRYRWDAPSEAVDRDIRRIEVVKVLLRRGTSTTAGLQRSPDTCNFRAKPANFRPQPLSEEESNWAETFTVNSFYQKISHTGKLDHHAN